MPVEPIVFVVDDDRASAASIEALIRSRGMQAEIHHSAEDFLAAYDPGRKGCLVLDIRLTAMSGIELQQELVSRGATLPIVMISGHVDRAMSERVLQDGAVACLEKPFPGEQLEAAIRSALERAADV